MMMLQEHNGQLVLLSEFFTNAGAGIVNVKVNRYMGSWLRIELLEQL